MRLTWRKNKKPTGLARNFAGPRGSTLFTGDGTKVATVSAIKKDDSQWYWVAGWGHPSVPHKNTCDQPFNSEQDAKNAAKAYVIACLPPNT